MQRSEGFRQRSWLYKFRCALRGAKRGIRGESNFFVHFFAAAGVVAAGIILRVDRTEWCLLILCITAVLVAEMFNCALEHLAQAITQEHDIHVGDALDIGSASVLLTAIGASIVGTIVFLHRLSVMLNW